MSYQNILTERIDKIALITLNRPEKLNAMNYELASDLDEELRTIENDDDVRAVILTGAGPRAFSSGGDIIQMVGMTTEDLAARSEFRSQANWHIATFRKPIIGAINDLAYGAGAMLTSMLDIRIGYELTEFRFLAARYGRVNSTWSLPLLVGMGKAKELLYTGRVVKADEAERIGLVSLCVEDDQVQAAALDIAVKLSVGAQSAIRLTKHALNNWYRAQSGTFDASLAFEFLGFGGPDVYDELKSRGFSDC